MIIYAPNIHQGGGKTLLTELLSSLQGSQGDVLFLDSRLESVPLQRPANTEIKWVLPTILGRLKAEYQLHLLSTSDQHVLCFGNLPPLFSVKGTVHVYLQNKLLVEPISTSGFDWFVRFRILVERIRLKTHRRGVKYIVQTKTMQASLKKYLGLNSRVLPFVPRSLVTMGDTIKKSNFKKDFDFIYVASGEPHKNHRNLIRAWSLLAKKGLRPSLCLTLNKHVSESLLAWITAEQKKNNLHVVNFSGLKSADVRELYKKSSALIYPSMLESLGLPLLEANSEGLPIIAAELDYVRDLLDPEESFDPESPQSIARAVRRFLKIEEERNSLMEGKGFFQCLLTESSHVVSSHNNNSMIS